MDEKLKEKKIKEAITIYEKNLGEKFPENGKEKFKEFAETESLNIKGLDIKSISPGQLLQDFSLSDNAGIKEVVNFGGNIVQDVSNQAVERVTDLVFIKVGLGKSGEKEDTDKIKEINKILSKFGNREIIEDNIKNTIGQDSKNYERITKIKKTAKNTPIDKIKEYRKDAEEFLKGKGLPWLKTILSFLGMVLIVLLYVIVTVAFAILLLVGNFLALLMTLEKYSKVESGTRLAFIGFRGFTMGWLYVFYNIGRYKILPLFT